MRRGKRKACYTSFQSLASTKIGAHESLADVIANNSQSATITITDIPAVDIDNSPIYNTPSTMSARTDSEATQNQASSGVTPDTLRATLVQKLEAQHVDIVDLSGTCNSNSLSRDHQSLNRTTGGCGQMFEAVIVSPHFAKKTTLARHRLVNSTLKDEIAAIHAWTPKCFTPEEWEKKKGSL